MNASGPARGPLPFVSMVMATNRVSPFLLEALESIHQQSYTAMEIIVVDDGCLDREALDTALNRFPDLVVVHQDPSGVSIARNVGVSRARGSLVGFFDDDDRYPVDWVEKHVQAHLDQPDVVLTYGDVRSIDAAGNELMLDRSRQADIHDVFRRTVGIMGGTLVVRRDTLVRVGGFNPLLGLAEDLDLVLRCAYEGPFGYVAGLALDYRTHGGNVTRRHRELVHAIQAVIKLHQAAAQIAGRSDLARDLRKSRSANGRFAFWSAARVARRELRSGRPVSALGEFAWALRVAPMAPLSRVCKYLFLAGRGIRNPGDR